MSTLCWLGIQNLNNKKLKKCRFSCLLKSFGECFCAHLKNIFSPLAISGAIWLKILFGAF